MPKSPEELQAEVAALRVIVVSLLDAALVRGDGAVTAMQRSINASPGREAWAAAAQRMLADAARGLE